MKKNILASLVLSALIASPVFAEGFYIGADVGSSKAKADSNGYSIEKSDTAWGIHGGYKFSPYLAAELGYRSFGKFEENYSFMKGSVEASAVQASVIGSYPFSEAFNIYGRLGVASIKTTSKISSDFYNAQNDQTDTKALFGIGAQYSFNKNLSMRTEYTQYAEIEDVKLSAITIGANYSF
ncbi:outer membrane beta-barrel protein [Iodobacter sp. HSC-16F04]|uniref:Outer membrane beta-barrel protein n=1 Tax=Iodobacter violaceini TaxID=3044271 RepID=A0ABX0KUD3_9NEIS|nr:outer membrane beta-barrel protein [Iodobacter violacea]NHQ86077.1 outer membrane beta-barrel protein [Iodobacter violacea]